MGKLPAIQLYPNDWDSDPVAMCSIAAQGLWWLMMRLAHNSIRYGYLVLPNGGSIPPSFIARKAGIKDEAYTALLTELDSVGVPSRTPEGIIFSRRMVKDAKARAENRLYQHTHRSKSKETNENSKTDVSLMSGPSSTSTSSTKKQQIPSREKRGVDARHVPFKLAIETYWTFANKGTHLPFTWGPADAKQLSNLLAATPELTLMQFQALLQNRARSPGTAHGTPPHKWLSGVLQYSQPLNQFNRTTETGNGTVQGNSKESPAVERRRVTHDAIRAAAIRRYGHLVADDDGSSAGVQTEPGTASGDARCVPEGMGGVGAEVRLDDFHGRTLEGTP
jgi:hypothetical protein